MATASPHSPSDQLKTIAVIIVNYGTADLTIAGVNSVLTRHHGGRTITVHVVDNASPDDSAEQLARAHAAQDWGDKVTLYLETENHGFGRGNNVVLHKLEAQDSPPDAVFLLNPDAHLENEAIDILAHALETDPGAGFAGAGVTHPSGAPMTAAFRFPSVIGEFTDAFNFSPVAKLLGNWSVPLPADHPEGPVDWVSGAAVMGRFEALKEADFFDPGFFLYYEEVDLMHRAARAGWPTRYVPEAQVVHIGGEATGFNDARAEARALPQYHYDSWQYYFRQNHSRPIALLAALAKLTGSVGNWAVSRVRGRTGSVPKRFFRDFWAYCLHPLLGAKG